MGNGDYNIFHDNYIKDFNEHGFFIEDSVYNSISNNTIQNSEKYGIYVEKCNHSIITGNPITFRGACITEINYYGNTIEDINCQRIASPIYGYFMWILLGISVCATIVIIKSNLNQKIKQK